MSLSNAFVISPEMVLHLAAVQEQEREDSMLAAIHEALLAAFAPLDVELLVMGGPYSHAARFIIGRNGLTHPHSVYLTRKGELLFTLEKTIPLDDPACFEKVASEMKANLDAM